eukprot:RCo014797
MLRWQSLQIGGGYRPHRHDLLDDLLVLLDGLLQLCHIIVKQVLGRALPLHRKEGRVVPDDFVDEGLPLCVVAELAAEIHLLQELPELVALTALLLLLVLLFLDFVLLLAALHLPDVVLEDDQAVHLVQHHVPGVLVDQLLHLPPLRRHGDPLGLLQQLPKRRHVLLPLHFSQLPVLLLQLDLVVLVEVFPVAVRGHRLEPRVSLNEGHSLFVGHVHCDLLCLGQHLHELLPRLLPFHNGQLPQLLLALLAPFRVCRLALAHSLQRLVPLIVDDLFHRLLPLQLGVQLLDIQEVLEGCKALLLRVVDHQRLLRVGSLRRRQLHDLRRANFWEVLWQLFHVILQIGRGGSDRGRRGGGGRDCRHRHGHRHGHGHGHGHDHRRDGGHRRWGRHRSCRGAQLLGLLPGGLVGEDIVVVLFSRVGNVLFPWGGRTRRGNRCGRDSRWPREARLLPLRDLCDSVEVVRPALRVLVLHPLISRGLWGFHSWRRLLGPRGGVGHSRWGAHGMGKGHGLHPGLGKGHRRPS